jgi:hypothetical protein
MESYKRETELLFLGVAIPLYTSSSVHIRTIQMKQRMLESISSEKAIAKTDRNGMKHYYSGTLFISPKHMNPCLFLSKYAKNCSRNLAVSAPVTGIAIQSICTGTRVANVILNGLVTPSAIFDISTLKKDS